MTTLLILGASARAAAASAVRAGLAPVGLDLFADRDLAALGPARRVEAAGYPDGLLDLADAEPDGPWIYTGALENRPDLVDRLAASRPLWGVSGEGLRAVRDPIAVAKALGRSGLPHPAVRLDPDGLPLDGSWLVKPIASAGGRRIEPLTASTPPARGAVYYQGRLAGPSLGAVFLGAGQEGGAELAGVVRHRFGPAFAYAGVVGPLALPSSVASQVERIGRTLAGAFGLAGLFGVDLILQDGVALPVEVNPRYTASVEVLELATGRSLLAGHRRAFEPEAGPGFPSDPAGRPGVVGKAVVYAEAPCEAPAWDGWRPGLDPWSVPRHADIPEAGTRFDAGDPVLSLLQAGPDLAGCQARLDRRVARWRRRLLGRAWAEARR